MRYFINSLRLSSLHSLLSRARCIARGITIVYPQGAWSIGWDDVVVLDQEITRYVQYSTMKYLELGSGLSTVAVYKILKNRFSKAQILSLESEKNWELKTRHWLEKNEFKSGPESSVEFRQLSWSRESLFSTFEQASAKAPFDIIFVDAPPDTSAIDARKSVIEIILEMKLLSPKGSLILHDCDRAEELYALESLRGNFRAVQLYSTRKGIAVLRFPR